MEVTESKKLPYHQAQIDVSNVCLCAGWLVALAPWGAQVAPHVWIVAHGTGNRVMEKIITPMAIKGFGVRGDGASTLQV